MISRRAVDRPVPADLNAMLREVGAALDTIAAAVIAHDRDRLDAANTHANDLLAVIAARGSAPDASTVPTRPDGEAAATLVRGLRTAVRRNAMLIERAWAMDAATTRLLLSLGRGPADTPAGAYSRLPIVTLERSA